MARPADRPAFPEETPAAPGVLSQGLGDYAVITLDPQGQIVDWSSVAAKLFGYAREGVLGRYFGLLFTPEDRASNEPETEFGERP